MQPTKEPKWKAMPHAILDEEADQLYGEALQVPAGDIIVEIGSFRGSSSYALALGAVERNVKIYCVDTWMGSPGGPDEWGPKQGITASAGSSYLPEFKENLKEFIASGTVTPLEMSSGGALMIEPPLTPALLFIDGSHVFEDTFFDMTHWWNRLKSGGMMGCHDSSGAKDWHPQVKVAVDKFAKTHNGVTGTLKGCTTWFKKP